MSEYLVMYHIIPWTRSYRKTLPSIQIRTDGYLQTTAPQNPPYLLLKLWIFSHTEAQLQVQFIGAAPGSTGGGVKVTTFAVLILTMRSVAQGRDDCVIGGHHIESKTVYRALTIIMLGMVAALGSAVVVYYNTSDAVTVIDAIFESCSAFGTVGLSVGVTSQLNTGAKLLYMLVMFMGRVGPVSFAISLTSKPDDNKRKILPVGQINVG